MNRTHAILPRPSTAPESTDFIWATGIEDTFIASPDRQTGRILDEYALTGHYDHWEADLGLIQSLGVLAARYGIPWYRVEPRPGVFDWTWTDSVLEALVNIHHVEPIVDLMHYGTPEWLEGAFLSPDYPERVAEYAHAVAERYKDLCYWYTPLNEPRINAWYAGRLGWWPPYGRSWSAFVGVLAALARGIVETQRAIACVEPGAVFVHVDATDLYKTSDPALVARAAFRQALVFCALDLVQGRVREGHPLADWLVRQGLPIETLDWFAVNAVQPDVIGYNMYPMFSEQHLVRGNDGRVRTLRRRCGADTFSILTRMYAERYGRPVMCTETASTGSVRRRIRWIEESTRAVNRLRAEGVPVVGYTYWPLFSLIAWPYRSGGLPLSRYVVDMGLWDLRFSPDGSVAREHTAAVNAYTKVVTAPAQPLGAAPHG